METVYTRTALKTFTTHCESIQNSKEAGNLVHLYWNELEKASFAHGAAYSDGND